MPTHNLIFKDRTSQKVPRCHLRCINVVGFLCRSLFTKGRQHPGKIFGDLSAMDTDISFVSSDRPSTDSISTDHLSSVLFDSNTDSSRTPRMSVSSESSFGSILSSNKGSELSSFTDISSSSLESVSKLYVFSLHIRKSCLVIL